MYFDLPDGTATAQTNSDERRTLIPNGNSAR